MIRVLILAAVLDLCAGCAGPYRAYSGQARAPEAVATVSARSTDGFLVWITGVGTEDIGDRIRVHILPGFQTLRVLLSEEPGSRGLPWMATVIFRFDAAAGESYVIRCVARSDWADAGDMVFHSHQCVPVLEEERSGRRVAWAAKK